MNPAMTFPYAISSQPAPLPPPIRRRGFAIVPLILAVLAVVVFTVPAINKQVTKAISSPQAGALIEKAQAVHQELPPSPLTPIRGAGLLALAQWHALRTMPTPATKTRAT